MLTFSASPIWRFIAQYWRPSGQAFGSLVCAAPEAITVADAMEQPAAERAAAAD